VLVRRLIVRRAALRVMAAARPGSRSDRRARGEDVDGTAVDIEPDQLDRPR
jgi:hypothetical protein